MIKLTCSNCDKDCSSHHLMCDRDEGLHGEGCPTQVFGTDEQR